jgi:hypothetical protein
MVMIVSISHVEPPRTHQGVSAYLSHVNAGGGGGCLAMLMLGVEVGVELYQFFGGTYFFLLDRRLSLEIGVSDPLPPPRSLM